MADAAPGPRPRPTSPNIQLDGGIWRWHITMVASILHRATGVALYGGALVVMLWALSLSSGPDAYAVFTGLAGSILGKLVMLGLTFSVFFHLGNGLRHLFWDMGYGFKPKTADTTAWLVIAFAFVASAFLWALIAFIGIGRRLMALIRTPLGRARGLGSSKHGVGHFVAQRVTACALVLLVLWGAWSAIYLAHVGYDGAAHWLNNPLNAGLACLLAFAAFWHMRLGMSTIIEDYFQKAGTKGALLVANIFVAYLGGAFTIICILKVAFSGASV